MEDRHPSAPGGASTNCQSAVGPQERTVKALQKFVLEDYRPEIPASPAWKRDRKQLIAAFNAQALYTPHYAREKPGKKPGFRTIVVHSQELPHWERGPRIGPPTCNRFQERCKDAIPERPRIVYPLASLEHDYPGIRTRLRLLSRTINMAQIAGLCPQSIRRIRALVRLLWYGDIHSIRRWKRANKAARAAIHSGGRVPAEVQRLTSADCRCKYRRSPAGEEFTEVNSGRAELFPSAAPLRVVEQPLLSGLNPGMRLGFRDSPVRVFGRAVCQYLLRTRTQDGYDDGSSHR